MSQPYIGEIRMFAGNFAPVGWAFCNGAVMPIVENEALFQLIGTTYGGDGQTTYQLPDLQSRVPIHMGSDSFGNTYIIGQNGGVETVTLTVNQIAAHVHVPQCSAGQGTQASPANGVWAVPTSGAMYSSGTPSLVMDPAAIGSAGGSQPHDNMVPFLVVNFILSLFGTFPTQN